MQPTGAPDSQDAALQQLWQQVCASRGTPAPDPSQRAQFLQDLEPEARQTLETVLHLAARGREQPGDLGFVSWAAACTRPTLLSQLHSHSLAFTSAGLFACGLALKEQGWDMQPRLAQLTSNPADVDTLRAWLPAKTVALGETQAHPQALSGPNGHEDRAVEKPFFPWPDDEDSSPDGYTPGWSPMGAMDEPVAAPDPLTALPVLPTRFARQRPEVFPNVSGAVSAAATPQEPRLRLFGKSAAHTLEITPHRRRGDFMGVHVVSIDSAHVLSAGGGYAWERKLVIQLTPEEMPAVIATLMGLTPSVRFGHHGAGRDKFVEVRRQEGGLVMVTGEKTLSYSVPVPTASVYYVLDLLCRAMAMGGGTEEGKPGRSVADVIMLVRSAHSF